MSEYLEQMPEFIERPGEELYSSAKRVGEILRAELEKDKGLYVFSPDETTSNKIDAVYETTERAWAARVKDWDLPESARGRVVELLSENALFAVMMGHILGNREQAYFVSYEAFLSVITSQILQQIKFLKQVDETWWRHEGIESESFFYKGKNLQDFRDEADSDFRCVEGFQEAKLRSDSLFPAINLLSTSTCWRQDHNGFSHQSPALISTLLSLPDDYVNCLFPIDDVATAAAMEFMRDARNVVNLTTLNKTEEPRWIDRNHAKFQLENGGASVFQFASSGLDGDLRNDFSEEPEIVFTAAGDIVSREALFAMRLIREEMPGVRMRFVGISSLTRGAIGTTKNRFKQERFSEYFGEKAPIIANFHGYPATLEAILANYADKERLFVHGFRENGSTTTPMEMLRLNGASRYDLAAEAAKILERDDVARKFRVVQAREARWAKKNGADR